MNWQSLGKHFLLLPRPFLSKNATSLNFHIQLNVHVIKQNQLTSMYVTIFVLF